ncbi:hypothetical protein JCM3770_003319, partial [Rhodotorula araucariae]
STPTTSSSVSTATANRTSTTSNPLDAQDPVAALHFVQARFAAPDKWGAVVGGGAAGAGTELGVRYGADALQAQYAAQGGEGVGAGDELGPGAGGPEWLRGAGSGGGDSDAAVQAIGAPAGAGYAVKAWDGGG